MANASNFLSYNGIIMDLVKMHVWRREAIYNGNQYLYTRHILAVTCVLNPGVNPTLTSLAFIPNPFNQAISALASVLAPPGGDLTPLQPQVLRAGAGLGNVVNRYPLNPNPAANLPPFNAVAVPNPQLGMVTDTLIRHALMQPRQQLIYSLLGYAPLFSPWTGYNCDASGGPLPLRCDPVSIDSGKTWIINFAIQTDINECQKYTNAPKLLLSHTWSMNHSIDQDCYCVRTIEGRAVFARDRIEPNAVTNSGAAVKAFAVKALGNLVSPAVIQASTVAPILVDSFRQQLFHPLPTNFKREKVDVKLEPDGVTLNYVIVDRERALNINLPNVTRLEGTHTIKTQWGGAAAATQSVDKAIRSILSQTVQNLRFTEANSAGVDPIAEAALAGKLATTQAATFARTQAELVLDLAEGLIPQITHHINFKLWGNRNTTRAALTIDALALLYTRLAFQFNFGAGLFPNPNLLPPGLGNFAMGINDFQKQINQAVGNIPGIGNVPPNLIKALETAGGVITAGTAVLAGFHSEITHDLAGKYVEVNFSTLGSPWSMFLAGPSAAKLFVGPDDTIISGTSGILGENWDGQQGYPTTDISRGTYIEQIVTQILMAPCQTPPAQTTPVIPPTDYVLKPVNTLPKQAILLNEPRVP
jgi:hypothetical protein